MSGRVNMALKKGSSRKGWIILALVFVSSLHNFIELVSLEFSSGLLREWISCAEFFIQWIDLFSEHTKLFLKLIFIIWRIFDDFDGFSVVILQMK